MAGIQTGTRVGSAQINSNDEKQTPARLVFDPTTLVTKTYDVFDAPISVRAFRLQPGVTIYVQHSAGCGEGDEFEDLYIHNLPVTLTALNKLIILPIDGRYRFRLEGAVPEDVRIIAFRTNAYTDLTPFALPFQPTVNHLPLLDTFGVQLGYIDEEPD